MRHHMMALHHNHTGLGSTETINVTDYTLVNPGADSTSPYDVQSYIRFWANSYITEAKTVFGSVTPFQLNPSTDFVIPHRTITSGNEVWFRYEPVTPDALTDSDWESFSSGSSPNTWYAISSTNPQIRLSYTHPTTPIRGDQLVSLKATVKLSSTNDDSGIYDTGIMVVQISTQDL